MPGRNGNLNFGQAFFLFLKSGQSFYLKSSNEWMVKHEWQTGKDKTGSWRDTLDYWRVGGLALVTRKHGSEEVWENVPELK